MMFAFVNPVLKFVLVFLELYEATDGVGVASLFGLGGTSVEVVVGLMLVLLRRDGSTGICKAFGLEELPFSLEIQDPSSSVPRSIIDDIPESGLLPTARIMAFKGVKHKLS